MTDTNSKFQTELTLYNYFRSSTSYRVRLALEIKKLNYNYKPVHLINNGGEQNSESYRQINPMGGVPTLVHGNLILGQSFAIIEYLDEAFPQSYPLFPIEIKEKIKIKEFCQIINADIHSYGNLKTLQYLEKNFNADENAKNKWISDFFIQGLNACEKNIQKSAGSFCFGDKITAAECFLIPVIFTAQRFKVDLSPFKRLMAINECCLNLPEFQKAHPFRQPDTPIELKLV